MLKFSNFSKTSKLSKILFLPFLQKNVYNTQGKRSTKAARSTNNRSYITTPGMHRHKKQVGEKLIYYLSVKREKSSLIQINYVLYPIYQLNV